MLFHLPRMCFLSSILELIHQEPSLMPLSTQLDLVPPTPLHTLIVPYAFTLCSPLNL